jgi:hypothetical protein
LSAAWASSAMWSVAVSPHSMGSRSPAGDRASSVIHNYTKTFRGDQLAVLNRTGSTIARRPDGTTALAPSLPKELQDAFGEQTLLHFTLSQLRGQKSNKTALSKDQQVELLLSARRVIQKIVPSPARPASGSVKDTWIDADTLMLQVRLRLSACMREHDLSLKHNSILGFPSSASMRSSDRWARHTPRPSPGPQMRRQRLSLLPAQMPPTQRRRGLHLVKMPRARKVGINNPPASAPKRGSPRHRHHLRRRRIPKRGDTARMVTVWEGKRRQPARARRNRARQVMGRVEVSVREKPQKGPEMISLFLITH